MALIPDDVVSISPSPVDSNSAKSVDAGSGNYDAPTVLDDHPSEEARAVWEYPDNELNPMNWTDTWRWSIVVVSSYIEFLTLVFTPLLIPLIHVITTN